MLALLPGEEIITSSNNDVLVLTNRRLYCNFNKYGQQHEQTITLENITSCEMIVVNYFWLLIIAAVLVIVVLAVAQTNPTPLLLVALFCAIGYFATKRSEVVIYSSGTKIKIQTGKLTTEQIKSFMSKVEDARNRRLATVH